MLSILALSCALLGCDADDDDDDDANGGPGGGGGGATNGNSGAAGRAGTAGVGPVTSEFPDAPVYVDAHNVVRAAVKEPAGYSGTWQPVPPVDWSDEVARTAQEWANHLKSSQDCGLEHATGTGYGENLAAGSNVDAERAVDMWASEVENYTYAPEFAFGGDTGHYTQIVWRKTREIGCASAECGDSSVVVCRYDPPGNVLGAQPY